MREDIPAITYSSSANDFVSNMVIEKDLNILRETRAYREWLYSMVRPFLGRRILEAGSGIGNYTEKLIGKELIWATDSEQLYLDLLEKRFRNRPEIKTAKLDISRISSRQVEFFSAEAIDTVLIMNVLEHVEQDFEALARFREILRDNGRIVLIVPALKPLYGSLDRSYGHCKRYNRKEIEEMRSILNMDLITFSYFNLAGILVWFFNSMLFRKSSLPKTQTKILDRFVPVLRMIETRILKPPLGLSLLAVLAKR